MHFPTDCIADPVFTLLHQCGIPYLSESIRIDTITENLKFSSHLQLYLHKTIPWIQKLLLTEFKARYESLQEMGISEILSQLNSYSVSIKHCVDQTE